MRMARRKKLEKEKRIITYELKHPDTIILSILGLIGLILFWRGLATILESLEKSYFVEPVMFLFFGLVIIFLTGAMIRR